MKIVNREMENICIEFSKQYPVLSITGPRQSGKTTLANKLFPQKPSVNLELPDQRKLAINDPKGFLNQFPHGAVLDEIQRTPELPSYIQDIVDRSNRPGMFILTGSQQFEISQSISQSLAGRTAVIKLLPLSLKELSKFENKSENLNEVLLNGFYPRRFNESIKPYYFYSHYFETYIERDLRQLINISDLALFEKFIHILAGRTGCLLNYSNLSNDVGVSHVTIQKWITLLQASYVVFVMPPYYSNIGKRLLKTPKIYFYDTGLICYLLGIETKDQLKNHPLRGSIFENLIIIEFLKNRFNSGKRSNLYFYRERTGNEVDLIIESADFLVPVEIKSAETVNIDFIKGINHFKDIFKNKVKKSYVIFCGESRQKYMNTAFFPWKQLDKAL